MRIAKGSANSIMGTITKKESGTNLAISAQTRTNKLCSRRVRDLRTSMRCTLEQIKAKKQHIIVVSDATVYKQPVKLAPINSSIVPTLKRKDDSVSLNS